MIPHSSHVPCFLSFRVNVLKGIISNHSDTSKPSISFQLLLRIISVFKNSVGRSDLSVLPLFHYFPLGSCISTFQPGSHLENLPSITSLFLSHKCVTQLITVSFFFKSLFLTSWFPLVSSSLTSYFICPIPSSPPPLGF